MKENRLFASSLRQWVRYECVPNSYSNAFMEYPENLIFKSEELEDIYWTNPLDMEFF